MRTAMDAKIVRLPCLSDSLLMWSAISAPLSSNASGIAQTASRWNVVSIEGGIQPSAPRAFNKSAVEMATMGGLSLAPTPALCVARELRKRNAPEGHLDAKIEGKENAQSIPIKKGLAERNRNIAVVME
jgi:hypothetical protein